MKHLHIYIILFIATLLSITASAQSALTFTSVNADFGHIREDGGVATCSLEAINRGSKPVVVKNIITSCGCTTAHYERKPIAPNDTFHLKLQYDPMNRPGRISRDIYVEVSDSEESIKLHIDGYVTPRERSTEEIYPFDMGGGLRLQSNFHAFGYIEHGKEVSTHIGYINHSDKEIYLYMIPSNSSGALYIEHPKSIAPHATGDIKLTYRLSERSSRYGTLDDKMRIAVDGVQSQFLLTTYAIAVDNFDLIDDISAPRVDISKKIVKFGEVNCDNVSLKQSIEIRNIGNTPLIIRCAECSSDAIECDIVRNTTIAPNASHRLTIELHTERIEGDVPFVARIMLITNDPVMPMQQIRVNAIPMW